MKLRTKAGLLLFVLAIVLSAIVFVGFQQNKAAIDDEQAHTVNHTSTEIAASLDQRLSSHRRTVRLQATNPAVPAHGTTAQQRALEAMVAESAFDGASVIHRNGTMTAIVADIDAATRVRLVGGDFSDRQYFQRARAGETYIGAPLSADSGNDVVTISTPIYDNGTVVGTLNAALHLQEGALWHSVTSSANDHHGVAIRTADGNLLFERQPDPDTELVRGTARANTTGWTVSVQSSRTIVEGDLWQVTLYQTGGIGLVVLVLAVVGFVGYIRTIRYHEQLLDGFALMEREEYGHRIDADAMGEWQRLITGFNRVSETLEQYDEHSSRQRRELAETNAVLSSVLDNLPVGVLVENDTREITAANDRLFEVLGAPGEPSDVLGRHFEAMADELGGLFADPESFQRRNTSILESRESVIDEELRMDDGRTVSRSYVSYPLMDGTGNVWLYRDVTAQKEREQHLRVLGRVLRHNIRNDMNVIRGRAELFRDGTVSNPGLQGEKIVEQSDKLLETTRKEQAITKVLLDSPTRRSVELYSLLTSIVGDVHSEYPDARFSVECPSPVHVVAVSRLEIAIEELLTNAVIHSESPSPSVSVSVAEHDDTAAIEVRDEGPHIPDREQAVLAHGNMVDDLFHGTGLGLWVVYWIVKQSGGSVSVSTREPAGNTVTVELQLTEP